MKLSVGVFLILSALSLTTWAGEGHNHDAAVEPAPRGGLLRDAPPYKAELVLNGDQAKIYVYDKNLKLATVSSTTLEGKMRLPKQKKFTIVIFKRVGDAYEGTLTGASKVHRFDLHIDLVEGGKKTLIDFGIDNIH